MNDNNAPLAHMVYFTLKDNSQTERDRLAAACKKYLFDHPGVVYFNVGTRVPELQREVNDSDFDVCLTVVFQHKAAHDAYQVADLHNTFIDECKENWQQVRVFDSYLA